MNGLIVGDNFHQEPRVSIGRANGAHRISTVLRKQGVQVDVIDFFNSWTIEELEEYLSRYTTLDFLGLSIGLSKLDSKLVNPLIALVKRRFPGIKVVAGGSDVLENDYVGADWLDTCLDAVKNYRDESFVSQFLSPELIRKWHLFEVTNNESDKYVTISGIQDLRGYNQIRQSLSYQYSVTGRQPNIQVVDANLKGSRELKLKYTSVNGARLGAGKAAVLNHIRFLWGYDVSLAE